MSGTGYDNIHSSTQCLLNICLQILNIEIFILLILAQTCFNICLLSLFMVLGCILESCSVSYYLQLEISVIYFNTLCKCSCHSTMKVTMLQFHMSIFPMDDPS